MMKYENKIEDMYIDYNFFCPVCHELIMKIFHVPYVCGCGKRWKFPPPIDIDSGDDITIEMKGIVVKI
jgi:hypothetical protein